VFALVLFAGNLTLRAYEEDCEFADPAGSFRGLRRFKRNCTNFGSLLEKSDMKLTKWEDLEVHGAFAAAQFLVKPFVMRYRWLHLQDKSIGHWRFSCIMSFPWRPILSGNCSNFQVHAPIFTFKKELVVLTIVDTRSFPDMVFTVILMQQQDTRNTTSMLIQGRCAGTENYCLSMQFSDHIQQHPSMVVTSYRMFLSSYTCVTGTDRLLLVIRHVENWNVPKMALLRQIFRPSRWIWEKRTG
jgi:hypothetical protein